MVRGAVYRGLARPPRLVCRLKKMFIHRKLIRDLECVAAYTKRPLPPIICGMSVMEFEKTFLMLLNSFTGDVGYTPAEAETGP